MILSEFSYWPREITTGKQAGIYSWPLMFLPCFGIEKVMPLQENLPKGIDILEMDSACLEEVP